MDLGKVQRAAVLLFAAHGFAATGIRELGAAAGINSATIYHYTGSKEDLLASIMRSCLEAMIDAGSAALRISAEPTIQLTALVASHVGFTATNPLTSRVAEYEMRALGPENRYAMQGLRDEYESLFALVVERGLRVGDFTVDDATMARLALMEMGTGVAHWYRADGRLTLTEVQHNFVNMACKMLSADHTLFDGTDYIRQPVLLGSEPTPNSTSIPA
ncbi:TetR/AcrR family transcriptional regulator [Paeniglutamicibacter sp. NPDC091659]|uniref:TetR/AcrR family transcriptional regulator n=1 Tax=Paeniglutamicibacter sp. NPDC091659 TaxID=3364389 RepID=UPI00381BB294